MPSPVTSLAASTEDVMLSQPSTRLFVNSTPYGAGTLILANSRISWRSDAANSQFSIEYKGVSIHAVSRDVSKFPHQCLYLMVDGKVDDDVAQCVPEAEEAAPMDAENDDVVDDEEEDDDDDPVTEIRFVPADENQLDRMFAVMSDCQAMHPDSEEDNLSDDYEGEEEEGEEEDEGIGENGVANGHDDGAANGHADGEVVVEDPDAVLPLEDGLATECPTAEEMTPQGLATLRRLEQMLGGSGGGGAGDTSGAEPEGAQFEDAEDDDMEH